MRYILHIMIDRLGCLGHVYHHTNSIQLTLSPVKQYDTIYRYLEAGAAVCQHITVFDL